MANGFVFIGLAVLDGIFVFTSYGSAPPLLTAAAAFLGGVALLLGIFVLALPEGGK